MHAMETLKYLLIPLRSASIILIVLFSFLLLVAATGGLIGLPLAMIILSWFFKYGFAVLDQVADGKNEPPVLSYEMINPANESRPLGLMLIVGSFYLLTGMLQSWVGHDAVTVIRAIGLLLVPAIIMVQVLDGFMESLNPIKLLQIVIRVPDSYVLILALLAGAWWLANVLVVWLPAAELPLSIAIPFSDVFRIGILMYAWLASFAMIGGVLYVRREQLGFEPSHSPERSAAKAEKEREREIDRLIDRIFAEWRGGAYGNAWRTIEKHLAGSERPSDELQALFQRASQWPDHRLAHRLAQELIPHLLAARRTGDALKVARAQLKADVNFRPLKSEDTIKLIELARDGGDRHTARLLLAGFAERYEDDVARKVAGQLAQQLER
jgi:hypothetical protein